MAPKKSISECKQISLGERQHVTYGFCRVKPNSWSDFVLGKVSVKTAPSESSAVILAHISANSSNKTRFRALGRVGAADSGRLCERELHPPPSSRLPRTHYPKSSCGARFLARTWEQEGALWDVQVPSHVLQRNTRAAQIREQIFSHPPKSPYHGVFIWNSQ